MEEDINKLNEEIYIELSGLWDNANAMTKTNDLYELLVMFTYVHKRLDSLYLKNKERIKIEQVRQSEVEDEKSLYRQRSV